MVDLWFTSELGSAKEAVTFLAGPRLWIPKKSYPDFADWLAKTEGELDKGVKRGLFCFQRRQLVGALIYQRHKKNPMLLELKNLTVIPEMRRRMVASLLLRNAEIEGCAEFGTKGIICDAKQSNESVTKFLLRHAYKLMGTFAVYEHRTGADNVFFKWMGQEGLC